MSDVRHVPSNPRKSQSKPEWAECPVCHVALSERNLSKHLRKVHGESSDAKATGDLEASFEAKRRSDFIKAQEKSGKGKVEADDWKSVDIDSLNWGKVKVNKKYYKCWQCGKLLTKASTASHLLKKHGFRAKDPDMAHFWYFDEVVKVQYREKPNVSPSAKKSRKIRRVDWPQEVAKLSTYKLPTGKPATINCPVCDVIVSAKNVKKHFKKVHAELLKEKQAPKGVSGKADKDVGAKKKSLDIRPDYEYSEDVFDRAKVYQGGAYGLGKSRKH